MANALPSGGRPGYPPRRNTDPFANIRRNHRIKADQIRVISPEGKQLGVLPTGKALQLAQQFDLDLKRRQGRLLPVRILHKVAFSGDGAPGPSRSLVINRAPGEIKGEDLRAAEVRFARIFNSTPVAIAAVDAAGAVLRPNAAFARLAQAGLRTSAVNGRLSIFDLIADRDRAALSASIEAAALISSNVLLRNSLASISEPAV